MRTLPMLIALTLTACGPLGEDSDPRPGGNYWAVEWAFEALPQGSEGASYGLWTTELDSDGVMSLHDRVEFVEVAADGTAAGVTGLENGATAPLYMPADGQALVIEVNGSAASVLLAGRYPDPAEPGWDGTFSFPMSAADALTVRLDGAAVTGSDEPDPMSADPSPTGFAQLRRAVF